MTQVEFRSDVTVELVDHMGSDRSIADGAWVSTGGRRAEEISDSRLQGFINRLYTDGHGTPFEYPMYLFYLEHPIFVDRQLVKYRLSTINGRSGRYSEMMNQAYVNPPGRKLVQVGKTMDYEFIDGEEGHVEAVDFVNRSMAEAFWQNYQQLLSIGVAKEVARQSAPTNMYTSMYMQVNLRSLFNVLQQRMGLEGEETALISHPQYEITMVADKMAEIVKERNPIAWQAFVESGYRKL